MSPFSFDADTGEIPVGQHDVEIVEAIPGLNNKGNPNLRVIYELPGDGRQLPDWLTAVPRARWVWKRLWEAAGLPFPDDDVDVDEADLIGKRVHIEVVEDTYDGVVRNKVKDVSPYVGSDVPDDLDTATSDPPAADDDVPF